MSKKGKMKPIPSGKNGKQEMRKHKLGIKQNWRTKPRKREAGTSTKNAARF